MCQPPDSSCAGSTRMTGESLMRWVSPTTVHVHTSLSYLTFQSDQMDPDLQKSTTDQVDLALKLKISPFWNGQVSVTGYCT